jgi:hypothetical protein
MDEDDAIIVMTTIAILVAILILITLVGYESRTRIMNEREAVSGPYLSWHHKPALDCSRDIA